MSKRTSELCLLSPFWSFVCWGTALTGSLGMLVLHMTWGVSVDAWALGSGFSLLVGLFVASTLATQEIHRRQLQLVEGLATPLMFAGQRGFYEAYCRFTHALTDLAERTDPLLRDFALCRLETLCVDVEELGRGTIAFTNTETWRTAYRNLLESLAVKSYYSVCWARTGDYWNDPPGRQGIDLNYRLLERGFHIERILILSDDLWPYDAKTPTLEIRPWIEEQQAHGIWVSLVRESDLAGEPDLLQDFGIYGDRAVGVLELDERSRTVRFLLHFDAHSRRQAHERWERLQLYATFVGNVVDSETTRG